MFVRPLKLLIFSRPCLSDQCPTNIMLDNFALSAAFHINAQDCTHSYSAISQSGIVMKSIPRSSIVLGHMPFTNLPPKTSPAEQPPLR